jgi:hypothetical protein
MPDRMVVMMVNMSGNPMDELFVGIACHYHASLVIVGPEVNPSVVDPYKSALGDGRPSNVPPSMLQEMSL